MPEQKWTPSQALLDALYEIVGAENVSVGEPMAAHVTFRIGGPAAVMVSPQSPEQVAEVVRACGAAESAYCRWGSRVCRDAFGGKLECGSRRRQSRDCSGRCHQFVGC